MTFILSLIHISEPTSDSLIVMHGGKIAAYFEDTSTLTDDVMGEYMLGLKTQSEEEIRRVCHD